MDMAACPRLVTVECSHAGVGCRFRYGSWLRCVTFLARSQAAMVFARVFKCTRICTSTLAAGAVEVTMQMFMSNKPSMSRISTSVREGLQTGCQSQVLHEGESYDSFREETWETFKLKSHRLRGPIARKDTKSSTDACATERACLSLATWRTGSCQASPAVQTKQL